ncbi:MAG: aminoglycoside phosphotransferase family protein, partial [Deltaproteobacteria bacterium]|nr:aminoglycoside phosphotransferase family protein [Deltaproteobacteria bacterium]
MPRFPIAADATIERLRGGLINQTYLISTAGARFVLQRVNPLFSPAIHDNIVAVTAALERAGLVTPGVVPTNEGEHCLQLPTNQADQPQAVWRVMTHIEGTSFDVVTGPAQAQAAGHLVARFHAALDDLAHTFVGLRSSVHDTQRHMRHLKQTAQSQTSHRLFAPVATLATAILDDATHLLALPDLRPRVCHGDLKINNFLFEGTTPPLRDRAVCLIDLDTVGPQPLAFELGDAWRSWCNRSGEDQEAAELDLNIFEA